MARLITCGFEQNSTTVGMEIHQSNGVLVVGSGTVRTGTYALHTTALVSGTSQRASFRHVNSPTAGPFFGRAYLNITTKPSANNTIMRFSGGAATLIVKLTSTGTLILTDQNGDIATSAGALSTGVQYRLELKIDGTGGAGTHIATLRVDGADVVTASNRTFTNPTVQQFDIGGNMSGEAQTVGDWWWDDVAVNDNTGSVQTSYPGEGHVVHLLPTGNGDANSGVVRGGADSGADWSQLNEVTPNDATNYIEMATTTGVVWVNVQDASVYSIGGAYIIPFVSVGGRVTLASAGAGNWFPSIKSQASGVVLDGSPVTLALATWASNDDTSGTQQFKVTAYTDPQNGGSWTAAKLDSIQIGAKTTDGTPATRVTAIWAIVEYQVQTVNIPTVLDDGIIAGLSRFDGGLR